MLWVKVVIELDVIVCRLSVGWPPNLAERSACLTTNQEVAGSISGTSTILKWIRPGIQSNKPHDDSWVTTWLWSNGSD